MQRVLSAGWMLLLPLTVGLISPLLAQQAAPKKAKRFCNPIVSGQLPTKLLTVQYEWQGPSDMPITSANPTSRENQSVQAVHQFRLGFNRNLIAKPKLFMTLMGQYTRSQFQLSGSPSMPLAQLMDRDALHQFSLSSNLFKPLNEKHFLLFNASVEFNGNDGFGRWSGNNIYVGGAAIFGWKKGFQRMMGVGVLRAYRLGRVIHVPAFLYNRSFNKQWGVEALLPARANFRYKPGKKTTFTGGYDLEGGQFTLGDVNPTLNNRFLQRGEIRPKLGIETPVGKNFVFTVQAGVRINGRLSVTDSYSGKPESERFQLDLQPAPFVQAGIHLTRWPKAKRS